MNINFVWLEKTYHIIDNQSTEMIYFPIILNWAKSNVSKEINLNLDPERMEKKPLFGFFAFGIEESEREKSKTLYIQDKARSRQKNLVKLKLCKARAMRDFCNSLSKLGWISCLVCILAMMKEDFRVRTSSGKWPPAVKGQWVRDLVAKHEDEGGEIKEGMRVWKRTRWQKGFGTLITSMGWFRQHFEDIYIWGS